jgi:hypothetical protein
MKTPSVTSPSTSDTGLGSTFAVPGDHGAHAADQAGDVWLWRKSTFTTITQSVSSSLWNFVN